MYKKYELVILISETKGDGDPGQKQQNMGKTQGQTCSGPSHPALTPTKEKQSEPK